ncbi:MAG: zinc ABC transporter solute-binding protein [Candidatus Latescibacteria bacterium]|nr:zinc ABC transporter solute-binding protein [Candidatus Latescibacterota bacterium]NIM21795.1 zinc ABC transporter solute-binding protein [Candidatus Latescibacterota bacterium]NIM65933.1 zinc ABC transporter solute-binding protein [Candidatus Latescibacterota bacterium]NIO02678.1 zinc ABC transporter solute-binding protein [Candidatus Latescibacterota bacterium]NIO29659.1 zinc ABC transporter solute-binding protein [Candidatus Latescibacterota bacterium]
MNHRKSILRPLLLMGCLLVLHPFAKVASAQAAGSISDKPGASGKLNVYASILPLAFFVERIGRNHLEIHVMVGPGQSPATYEPTSKQLVQLAQSHVFFSIGVPFEKQLLPRIRKSFQTVDIVSTQAGIELMPVSTNVAGVQEIKNVELSGPQHLNAAAHTHSHSEGELDPHIWLNPRLAATIARNILEALIRIDPSHSAEYTNNHRTLMTDLEELDRKITEMLAPLEGEEFYVFHPAYGYFAEAYGLVQVSIERGGTSPGLKHLVDLIEKAKARKVRAIFIQPQFSKKSAETIADEIGADVVVMDPLSRDYLTNMKEMAVKIRKAIAN